MKNHSQSPGGQLAQGRPIPALRLAGGDGRSVISAAGLRRLRTRKAARKRDDPAFRTLPRGETEGSFAVATAAGVLGRHPYAGVVRAPPTASAGSSTPMAPEHRRQQPDRCR